MRTEPNLRSSESLLREQERMRQITRIVALVLAGASVFVFFFKLLFF